MAKNNALTKITDRARSLRRKQPGMSWKNAVKKAGVDYRSGRLGAVTTTKKKKDKSRQTGTSNKHYDEQRSARPPGARVPSGGKKVTYYERRKNRSDKPGSLTGLKADVKQKLSKALLDYELADTIKATKEAQQRKVKYRKILKSL